MVFPAIRSALLLHNAPMETIKFFTVQPKIPEPLLPLKQLAENFYFCWHPQVIRLFSRIDRKLWDEVHHNPVLMLSRLPQKRLELLAGDSGFVFHLKRIYDDFLEYMKDDPARDNGYGKDVPIAYLSAEFGVADSLPLYAGGLGVLAGDHLKCASDLNLPMLGIGLCYEAGYFHQYLNSEGWQHDAYQPLTLQSLPLALLQDGKGAPLQVAVEILGRPVILHVWKAQVGRVPLYLLDTNNRENPTETRQITQMLYGGNLENRIKQEILLGVGGARLLKTLGIGKYVCHLNEGHSAFVSLERIRALIREQGLSFDEAWTVVQASTVFTTHTPVPAGHDYFPNDLMRRYFEPFIKEIGISAEEFLRLGKGYKEGDPDFCMTVLGFNTSNCRNGVSRLHAEVSRKMWQGMWPQYPLDDVPIIPITNGVHVPSWMSHAMAEVMERFLPADWLSVWDPGKNTDYMKEIPDSELWRAHLTQRDDLFNFAHGRLQEQLRARNAGLAETEHALNVLTPNAFTIGFARRFATYKRGYLLFRDEERLGKILNNPDMPVQIIIAGKAHPHDTEGKKIIQHIMTLIKKPDFRDRVVFLEDYDINVARYMVRGVDLWLNTPRRPQEACGTSGIKAMANGVLNLSILDGWWDEGYEPGAGWAIGRGEQYDDPEVQDQVESRIIYYLLENEIVPVFFHRLADRIPHEWVKMMKNSFNKLCARFSYHRAMSEYIAHAYRPAREALQSLDGAGFQNLRELSRWGHRVREAWGNIRLAGIEFDERNPVQVGADLDVRAKLALGGLSAEDVAVDLYVGTFESRYGGLVDRKTYPMTSQGPASGDGVFNYQGKVACNETGKFGLKVRVTPRFGKLEHIFSVNLVYWG
jgi:starch phosphorylase